MNVCEIEVGQKSAGVQNAAHGDGAKETASISIKTLTVNVLIAV